MSAGSEVRRVGVDGTDMTAALKCDFAHHAKSRAPTEIFASESDLDTIFFRWPCGRARRVIACFTHHRAMNALTRRIVDFLEVPIDHLTPQSAGFLFTIFSTLSVNDCLSWPAS